MVLHRPWCLALCLRERCHATPRSGTVTSWAGVTSRFVTSLSAVTSRFHGDVASSTMAMLSSVRPVISPWDRVSTRASSGTTSTPTTDRQALTTTRHSDIVILVNKQTRKQIYTKSRRLGVLLSRWLRNSQEYVSNSCLARQKFVQKPRRER